ncbi:MAG: M3 family oligoendopeptidase [Rhodospirillaceae bacterium]|jgi:oligoendopeptidase F|nr:M3 family oligoendopeptidase [Rhodospirillaceae bacterium]MBT4701426.1 M3 family oligoendopeptidase [Rhodospirillaceae bacterium]MBT5033142.1 M3 family oligoendopeptidase [Rhodospirillaceae bacterium]MBT6219240.1 M3 family oligoendopeptidase [Rhodospirillaceae bacterium]MBT6363949.1 M3 family oligoendopeptidase [Rhodospirillaceae bacterium]
MQAAKTDLPEWDLSHLYQGPDSKELEADLAGSAADAKAFRETYKGTLEAIDGAGLGAAVAAFEKIEEVLGKAMSYAQLLFAADMGDAERGRFQQTVHERITEISSDLLFFTLELNRLDDKVLEEKLKDPAASHYQSWVRDVRVYRPHQLDDDLEKLLLEKSVAGKAAWVRLFEETFADMRFQIGHKSLTLSDTLNMLSDKDGVTRKKAAKVLGEVLGKHQRLFALITNTLAKDKEIEDTWRKYPRPVSSRNLGNQVEDDVVDALASSVKDAYPDLSHRYYKLKAKWFGQEQLEYWDRNAPLPDDSDKRYSWDEARSMVLEAYGAFEPQMSDIAQRFFDERWIDAGPRPGKDSGAFSHPTVPSAHPYILMNFHGKSRDVMTLAHELGHGVHQILSGPQGALMSDTPLTTAETASVFGEMLTFRAMLEGETDPARRKILLAGKVEDMLNTVVRQIAFHHFETKVHDERKVGELAPERLGEIWMEIQAESLGPAIKLEDEYQHFWAYIPHFIHTPFYVYAYAFGDCLVNSLYDVFSDGHAAFQGKYLEMLRAGGTLRHKELLAPFGLDASDPQFWKRGLNVVSGFIDELEQLPTD